MAKKTPNYILEDSIEYVIDDRTRRRFCARYGEFDDRDFIAMQVALSVCKNTYFERKNAPKLDDILGHLDRIATLASELEALLGHHYTGAPPTAAEDAVTRIRYVSVRAPKEPETTEEWEVWSEGHDAGPDIVTLAIPYLHFLESCATVAKSEAANLETFKPGQDSTHVKALLKDLRPVFERRCGRATFSTSRDQKRSSEFAEFAFDLCRLLPEECQPALESLIYATVCLRREWNRREASSAGK